MIHEKICDICLSYMLDDTYLGWMRCPSCSFMRKKEKSGITMEEILGDKKLMDLDDQEKMNIYQLFHGLNELCKAYKKAIYIQEGCDTYIILKDEKVRLFIANNLEILKTCKLKLDGNKLFI